MSMSYVVALVRVATVVGGVALSSSAWALTPTTYLGTTSGTTINGQTWGLWMGNWSNGYSGNNANYEGTLNSSAANAGRVFIDLSDFYVANTDGKIGSFTMTSGTLQNCIPTTTSGKTTRIGSGGTGGEGTFTQTGGTFYMNVGEMRLGSNGSSNGKAVGLYDISGGLFSTTGGLSPGGNICINRNQLASSGTVPVNHGELRISGSATIDFGAPTNTGLAALGFGPGDGTDASSQLTIIGSKASINIASIRMETSASSYNSGLIKYSFDQTGVSKINITGTGASLAQGYLDVDYTGSSITSGTTFTLMDTGTSGGAISMASTFALRPEDTTTWRLDLVDTNKAIRLTYTGSTILGAITINVGSGTTQTQTQAGYLTLSGSLPLVKTGGGTLVLTAANTLTGSTSVQQGTLQLANATALASSKIVPLAGGTVSLASYLQTTVGGLAPNAGGLVNLGNGLVTVASGLTPTELVTAILAGRGDGSWTGTSGITSSVAASDVAANIPRAVGWLDNGDGSVTAAFAAPGDTNLDWVVDVLDASNFLSFGKYDTGLPATWLEGDFNYDGVVDVLDAADFIGTGLYDTGNYNTPAGSAGAVAAVPEPSGLILVAWVGGIAVAAYRRRNSRSAGLLPAAYQAQVGNLCSWPT